MRGEHGPELDLPQTGGVVRTVRPVVVGECGDEWIRRPRCHAGTEHALNCPCWPCTANRLTQEVADGDG